MAPGRLARPRNLTSMSDAKGAEKLISSSSKKGEKNQTPGLDSAVPPPKNPATKRTATHRREELTSHA